jgi:hypothetical protein
MVELIEKVLWPRLAEQEADTSEPLMLHNHRWMVGEGQTST